MNIYLIDDDKAKVSFLGAILEGLRERTGGVPEFADGFGTTTDETYLDSKALMRAVTDPEGLCLLDMKFPDDSAQIVVEELINMLVADGDEAIKKLFIERRQRVVDPDYTLALLLLTICQCRDTKCLTISTAGTMAVGESVKDWGFNATGFPYDPAADNTSIIRRVVSAILALIDFVENLRIRTSHWFENDDSNSERLWHTWKPVLAPKHQTLIQRTWPWFPSEWWSNDASAQNLHENLKHLCGSTACWMGTGKSELRPLSVGAAYLLALMIMEYRFPGWSRNEPETLVESFQDFQEASYRWMPEQDQNLSEDILRAYVDVVNAVGVLKNTDQPGIKKIIFEKPGRHMQLVLTWSEEDVEKLAKRTRNLFTGKTELTVPLKSVSKTVANLQRLHVLSQVNSKGFGTPGYFYIEENSLHVGS